LAQGRQQALRDFLGGAFDDKSCTLHMTNQIGLIKLAHHQHSSEDPTNKMPIGEINLDEIHAKLSET